MSFEETITMEVNYVRKSEAQSAATDTGSTAQGDGCHKNYGFVTAEEGRLE
jgi:hypothetical protein